MKKAFLFNSLAFAGLLLPIACKSATNKESAPIAEPRIGTAAYPDSVLFNLKTITNKDSGAQQWLASYISHGKTSLFRIELSIPHSSGDSKTPALFGSGRFIANPSSDPSAMIADLQRALEATSLPQNVKRESSLPFTYVTLGDHQVRLEDGSFTSKPSGNWTPMKIFIGKGDQESEVFMNLSSADGKGEFSMKDSEYGDAILAKLASVL